MNTRVLLRVIAGALAFGIGCGESTAPPAPVATVVLSPASVELVPNGTDVIVATPKDAAGNNLTDRVTTWSSSDPSKVTVAAGVVTGVGVGTATITATIEGHAASMDVAVREGAVVSASGLSFTAENSAVSVVVPSGALTQTRNLTVAPAQNPPPNDRLMPGTAFDFGPTGTTFASPVTLTIKYDPAKLTGGSPEAGLQLYEVVGTSWRVVAGSTANTTDHTVTGSVSHFTVYGVLMQPRVETISINADMTVPVQTTVQFAAVLKDNEQQPLTRPVTWSSSDPSIVQIDANGSAKTLVPGQATITATSEGKSATSKVTVVPGPAAKLAIVAGDAQSVAAGAAVPVLPAVKVTDAFDNPVSGFSITFAVASGGGTITGGATTTNASGIATVGSWTVGTGATSNTLTASGTGLTPASVTFGARVAFKVVYNGGDGQSAGIGQAVATAPSVLVVDATDAGVANYPITFAVTGGGGTVVGGATVTNANGFASPTSWILGPNAGANTLSASAGSIQGSPVVFNATALAAPPVAMAIFAGNQQTAPAGSQVPVQPAVLITDASGRGVPGVNVAFTIRSGNGAAITGANALSNSSGIAALGSWTLGVGGNSLFASVDGLSGSPLVFFAVGTVQVQVVTFGDSNTDFGFAGTDPSVRFSSYVSNAQTTSTRTRLGPSDPNSTYQLAGKIEARWRASRPQTIRAVNHGIAGTNTGTGRDPIFSSPNAREAVNGVTRFQGEALGAAYPWSGGESVNVAYPDGPVARVQAFTPRASDFLYISMGTNDAGDPSITTTMTLTNLEWMIDSWTSLGLPVSHLMITTIPPRDPSSAAKVRALNDGIRALAQRKGAMLIDLVSWVSNDNGGNWSDPSFHVTNDLIHYSEVVRDMLASAVVSYMSSLTP